MKTSKKITNRLLPFALVVFLMHIGMGCEEDDISTNCVKGKVLGYDRCNQVSLIQIISGNIKGDSLRLFEREYNNVVQYPNSSNSDIFTNVEFQEEAIDTENIIYFNFRFFDPNEDEWPENDVFCPHNIGAHDLPIIIVTNFSKSNCPSNHEK